MAPGEETTVWQALAQLLCEGQEDGTDRFLAVLRLLLNEVMKIERATALGADPYERSEERRGYANGYKPKCQVPPDCEQ